jgi:hypothetical protein
MTSPRTDHNAGPPASSARGTDSTGNDDSRLSPVQVMASALAAVSAAVIASLFGVAGTVIGAAVVSVASTVGAAVYTESMRRTHAGLRRAGRRLVQSPQSPADRSAGDGPPLPAHLDPRRSRPRRRWARWAMVAATGVAVFGLAMAVVTTVELIGQKPVSALVGGSDQSGGTTLGSLIDATGGDSRQQQAPGSPSTTPTGGNAPASDSPPTATSGAESTVPSASNSAPATPTAPAEEQPATPAPERSASASSEAESTAKTGQPSSGLDSSP